MEIREMTKGETQMFLTLRMMKPEKIPLMYQDLHTQSWVLRAIEKHFEVRLLVADKALQIMILVMGDGAVGKCVSYINYMQEWAINNQKTEITFQNFIYQICPLGIPVLSSQKE